MSGAQGAQPPESKTATTYESVVSEENRSRMELRSREDERGVVVERLEDKVEDASGEGGPVFGAGNDDKKDDLGVTGTATVYGTATSRALSFTDRYLSSSDPLKSLTTSDLYSSYTSSTQTSSLLAAGFDGSSSLATEPLLPPGIKRPTEALYYPTVMASHNVIGQTEDWYSTSPLLKRLKLESASNLSIYPQRPGEKDCAHYMLTRTCKFGDSCKFDHPLWVPEGGIPDWKEVPVAALSESLPERPGEPDCPYFLKTQKCKFGVKCKFNHPKDQAANMGVNADVTVLPERPSEPECAFYMKTGKCKFGANCRFHHPKDIQVSAITSQISAGENAESITTIGGATAAAKPVLYHNTKGLPVRLGEVDCPFYLKTGSCKYGASCRYNHPDRIAFDALAAIANPIVASPAASLNIGVGHPATSIYQTIDPRLGQSTIIPTLGVTTSIYPQRPGQSECDYYMKTGVCKFGERCKFHHPLDRSAPIGQQASQTAIKLTPAGLPRREGAVHCPYYMKTGTCKFGVTCKFDHPPPGEAVAMAATVGVAGGEAAEGEANGGGNT